MLPADPTTHNQSSKKTRRGLLFSRRQTLTGFLVFGIAAILGVFGRMANSFTQPTKPANSYGGMVDAGPLANVPVIGSEPRAVPQGRFWLIHDEDGISALHSSCTHLECLFNWDKEKKLFVCPCHGSEFSKNGQVLKGPAQRNLDRFAIQLVEESGTLLRASAKRQAAPLQMADLLLPANRENETIATADTVKEQKRILVRVDTSRKIPSP